MKKLITTKVKVRRKDIAILKTECLLAKINNMNELLKLTSINYSHLF